MLHFRWALLSIVGLSLPASASLQAADLAADLERLKEKEAASIIHWSETLARHREQPPQDEGESAKAVQSLEVAERRYRAICLRILQFRTDRGNPPGGLASLETFVRELRVRSEGVYAQAYASVRRDVEAAAGGIDRAAARGRGDGRVRVGFNELGAAEDFLASRSPRYDARGDSGYTGGIRASRRLFDLTQTIITHDPAWWRYRENEDRELAKFITGTVQQAAFREYKRVAHSGLIVDPRTGKALDGQRRVKLAGDLLVSLSEALKARGSRTDFQKLMLPERSFTVLAEELAQEIEQWKEYRLMNFLSAGAEPTLPEFFLAAALAIRGEQERINEWFTRDYLGGSPWNVGLGKLLRASNALGTTGVDEVRRRIGQFDRECNAAVNVLQNAARTANPAALAPNDLKLLQAYGYVTESPVGGYSYQIPAERRGLSAAAARLQRKLDLPGASALDFVNLKTVGVVLASIVVPEMVGLEAAALADAAGASDRVILGVKMLAELAAGAAMSAGEQALETGRVDWQQLFMDSIVLGGVQNVAAEFGQTCVKSVLGKAARGQLTSRLRRQLAEDPAFRSQLESSLGELLGLATEVGLAASFQAFLQGQEVDATAFESLLVQSVLARSVAAAWQTTSGALRDFSIPQTPRELLDRHGPEWLKRKLMSDEALAAEVHGSVVKQLQLIKQAQERFAAATDGGRDVTADRLFHALATGQLTRRELNRAFQAATPAQRPAFQKTFDRIKEYFDSMVVEARYAAAKELDVYFGDRRQQAIQQRGSETAAEADLKRLDSEKEFELSLLYKDVKVPGSGGPDSDIDRSSESRFLRLQLRRIYDVRMAQLGDGDPPTSARAFDVNEYINVFPFAKENREYAKRTRDTEMEDGGLLRKHGDYMRMLSLSARIMNGNPEQIQNLRGATERASTERHSKLPAAEARRRIDAEMSEFDLLLSQAQRDLADSYAQLAKIRREIAAERRLPPESAETDPDIGLLAQDKLYDLRMTEVGKLLFELHEVSSSSGPASPRALQLRANIERTMSRAMRDGIEAYSQLPGIDVVVNLVQSADKIVNGKPERMNVADRLLDPEFVQTGQLSKYTRDQIDLFYDDQIRFVTEHVNAFNSGHETAYETGRGLGKYVERALLAMKINGDFDPRAVGQLPIFDPRRRLLEAAQRLSASKGDPQAVKDVLSSYSTAWPRIPENGVLELMRTMEQVLPGMKHQTGAAALQRKRNAEETARAQRQYTRFGHVVRRRLQEQVRLVQHFEGAAGATGLLMQERSRMEAEMRALRDRIVEIERLARNYLGTDWNRVVRLQEELDGLRLVLDALPHQGTAIHGRYSQEAAGLEEQLRAARERRAAAGEDLATKLYENAPEYARLQDRLLHLTNLLKDVEKDYEEAEKRATVERFLAQVKLGGSWVGGPDGTRKAKVTIKHDGDQVRMDIEWEGLGGASPQLRVDGKLRFGMIEGVWHDLADSGAGAGQPPKIHGLFEARLSDDGNRIELTSRTLRHPRRKELTWDRVVFTRGAAPADGGVVVPGPERYVTTERFPGTAQIRSRSERLRTFAYDDLERRVVVASDVADGKSEAFFEDGKRAWVGQWVLDKQEGLHRAWYRDGKPSSVSEFRGGRLHGRETIHLGTGWVKTGTYQEGVKEGICEDRGPNGEIETRTYRSGKLNGPYLFRRIYIRESGTYVDEKLHGEQVAENLRDDGSVHDTTITTFERGVRMNQTFLSDGISTLTSFDGDVQHGPFVRKIGDQILSKGEYRRGKQQGEWIHNNYTENSASGAQRLVSTTYEVWDNGVLQSSRTEEKR